MPREDASYLLDMLFAARDAVRFAAGLTFEQFEEIGLHQNAILKSIEVIGEAASRISVETSKAHADIPWLDIIGMRNRVVHAYFEVNLRRVWGTVQEDLPRLITLIEPHVPPDEP